MKPAGFLVELDNLVLSPCQDDEFDDAFQQFTARAARGREHDDLEAEREREARTEDGNAAKHTRGGGDGVHHARGRRVGA